MTAPTPPTRAGLAERPALPSTWPMILGVLCIVFGLGAAVTYGVCSPVMTLLLPGLADIFRDIPGAELALKQIEAVGNSIVLVLAMNLTLGVLGALLLAAGIGMVRRRAWGMRLAIIWAIGKIIVAIPNALLSYSMSMAQVEAMKGEMDRQAQNSPAAAMGPMMEFFTILGLGFGVLWALMLPVFMLIWFRRAKVRAEVATWRTG